ncbi:MAG TPA: RcnB family protein [Croceibacterium sp.]|nr:RcnB family protein [Croceibacterium sp.]
MKFTVSTGGALAAALAFTAVPAQAQPTDNQDHHGHHQRAAEADQRARGPSGHEHAAPAAPRPAPPQARPQARNFGAPRPQQPSPAPQARQVEQRNWNQQARQQQQQRTSPQGQHWNGDAQRHDRNGTYTDQGRNTTYQNRDRNWSDNRGGNNRNWQNGNRDNRQWDRSWRNNNRYDWQRYRSTNRSAYHVGHYYAPYRGYTYRRLGIGFYLDPLFFGQDYWIGDPGYYRLPDVYGPYRWVRYYDDALLVDIYSGEVVDVIYDFFW